MKPQKTLARAPGLEGQELVLQERDGVFVIRSGGRELMSSARHHSEEELARIGLKSVPARGASVLIGGLGLGYTVRAALDVLPRDAHVRVAEISPHVVEWNGELLQHLAGAPLLDPRVSVDVADVMQVAADNPGAFDSILLDVDNGPSAMSAKQNQGLYEPKGVEIFKRALRPGGVIVVWSAGPDRGFVSRFGRAGFEASEVHVPPRPGTTALHVLFVARLPAGRGNVSARPRRPSR